MLGEVNLTHSTSAEQALNNVASEDLTVVQRHVRKPTNDKANACKERGHQTPLDTRRTADRCGSADRKLGAMEQRGLTPSWARPELDALPPKRGGDGRVGDALPGAKPRE
jgi:hypothetical protein